MKIVHLHSLLKLHRLQYYLKAAGVEKGSGEPNKTKVASVTKDQVREIAQTKMQDLNAADEEQLCVLSKVLHVAWVSL